MLQPEDFESKGPRLGRAASKLSDRVEVPCDPGSAEQDDRVCPLFTSIAKRRGT